MIVALKLVGLYLLAFGYLGLLIYLSFVNWQAAIFLLLLAIATNQRTGK